MDNNQPTEGLSKVALVDFYRQMRLIRVFEERAGEEYMKGYIRGFLHLYIGEEAIAVGAIAALEDRDYVVTHYRDHGHALARGLDPKAVMAELFGKDTGCSRGRGGSMHLFDASRNFMGGYAIVGGQLPIAVGLAQAISYQEKDGVVLCFLGDGALNEGEFHESMNLASIWNLPVVFFVENNLYGMGSPVSEVFAAKEIYKISDAYDMPGCKVDGMNVMEVWETTQRVVDWVREDNGPYFIEGLTYRFRGHSMADPADYRKKSEEDYWRERDPLITFRAHLQDVQGVSNKELNVVDKEIELIMEDSLSFARESPEPGLETLTDNIYFETTEIG